MSNLKIVKQDIRLAAVAFPGRWKDSLESDVRTLVEAYLNKLGAGETLSHDALSVAVLCGLDWMFHINLIYPFEDVTPAPDQAVRAGELEIEIERGEGGGAAKVIEKLIET